jgi:DNA-binding LytR/AlgR family response regulator
MSLRSRHPYIFIRSDKSYVRIDHSAICYIEGAKNYCKVVTDTKIYLVHLRLHQIQKALSSTDFIQIHRSYIVSMAKIVRFSSESVYIKEKELPLAASQRKAIMNHTAVLGVSE